MYTGDQVYADDVIHKDPAVTGPKTKDGKDIMFWLGGRKHVTDAGDSPILPKGSDLESFRARYKYHLEDAALADFFANVPLFATWVSLATSLATPAASDRPGTSRHSCCVWLGMPRAKC